MDKDSPQEELRARGFRWHGLESNGEEKNEDGVIVMPGYSLGVCHYELTVWRNS